LRPYTVLEKDEQALLAEYPPRFSTLGEAMTVELKARAETRMVLKNCIFFLVKKKGKISKDYLFKRLKRSL